MPDSRALSIEENGPSGRELSAAIQNSAFAIQVRWGVRLPYLSAKVRPVNLTLGFRDIKTVVLGI